MTKPAKLRSILSRQPLPYRIYPGHWVADEILAAINGQDPWLQMVSFTDHESRHYLRLPTNLRNLLDPWILGLRLTIEKRNNRLLLRELHLISFALALPLLIFFRRRLTLMLHANVQLANKRTKDALCLRLLLRAGFRFLLVETTAGTEAFAQPPYKDRFLAIPHPLKPKAHPTQTKSKQTPRPVVGLVGTYRQEKGHDRLLEPLQKLSQNRDPAIDLIIGSDNPRFLNRAEKMGITTLNTQDPDNYQRAIANCDILIYPYDQDAYHYRSSGGIADAIAASKLVVTIDAPNLRHQIEWPTPVGSCYQSIDQLPDAILRACTLLEDAPARFAQHHSSRSRAQLTKHAQNALAKLPSW